jgi:hypothetical protein
MESELAKFRKKKRIENAKGQFLQNLQNGWSRVTSTITRAVLPERDDSSDSDDNSGQDASDGKYSRSTKVRLRGKKRPMDADADSELNEAGPDTNTNSKLLHYFVIVCKTLIWVCMFMGFLKLELGAIFVIVSIFWLMWVNMNTGKRKKSGRNAGPSAYSVFNPNCEAIDGTLKAEQLEKQLLFRETK